MPKITLHRRMQCRRLSLPEGFEINPLGGKVRPAPVVSATPSVEHWPRGPIESGSELAMAVMQVLGIETRHAMSVTIEMEAGEIATVSVKRLIPTGAMNGIAETFQQYQVRPKEGAASSVRLSS